MSHDIQNYEIPKLNKLESVSYFAIWSGAIIYSIYQVHCADFCK